MITKRLPGSSFVCIGSAGSGLGGRHGTGSGLGGSGFGLGVGVGGDLGGRGDSLEYLLLKVNNDGGIPCNLECF